MAKGLPAIPMPSTCSNSMATTCAGSPGRFDAGKLARLLRGAGHGVQLSDHMEGHDGQAAFRHACAMGLEGIVAKRRDRPYRSGRSPDWIKVKNPDAPAASRVMEW
jgi:hypothetical protein